MPTRSRTPCKHAGCLESVPCPTHGYKDERPSAALRGYGFKWRKIRKAVLNEEPYCRMCMDEDKRPILAAEVDHIDGNPENNDRENLRPLCKPHHSRRTATEQAWGRDGGAARRRQAETKRKGMAWA